MSAAPAQAGRIRRRYGWLDRLQGRSVLRRLDQSLERETLEPAELGAYARERLRSLLHHCRRDVPFYRERLGSLAGDADTLAGEAFPSIPVLEKADLAASGEALLSVGIRDADAGLTEVTSGGTTGPPTRVVLDRDTVDAHTAATLRSYLWFGADPTRPHVMLWGPPPDENTYASPFGRLKGFVLGRTLLPTYGMDEARAQDYAARIRGRRFDHVAGYSSALLAVARALLTGAPAQVSAGVIAAAEPIFDFQRAPIERAFGAPVRERYGCNEFSLIAQECREGSLHVATDRVLLEIVREDGSPAEPGEIGTVLVTDLDNRAMPLVRYRIGDLAAWGRACACGRPFPVLERIHGRLRDALPGPQGRLRSPHAWAEALKESGARGFQLVVDLERRVREVRIESEPFPLDTARARWAELVDGPQPEVRFVEAIERSTSGKVLPVISSGSQA